MRRLLSGLSDALWSKPAQGIKQIINEIIWAGIRQNIPRDGWRRAVDCVDVCVDQS